MPRFVGWWYVGEVLSNFTMPGIGQPGYCTAALTETLLGFWMPALFCFSWRYCCCSIYWHLYELVQTPRWVWIQIPPKTQQVLGLNPPKTWWQKPAPNLIALYSLVMRSTVLKIKRPVIEHYLAFLDILKCWFSSYTQVFIKFYHSSPFT